MDLPVWSRPTGSPWTSQSGPDLLVHHGPPSLVPTYWFTMDLPVWSRPTGSPWTSQLEIQWWCKAKWSLDQTVGLPTVVRTQLNTEDPNWSHCMRTPCWPSIQVVGSCYSVFCAPGSLFLGMGILIIDLSRWSDCLRFIMGLPILVDHVFFMTWCSVGAIKLSSIRAVSLLGGLWSVAPFTNMV